MEYVNRYVRSESCRQKCGQDFKGEKLFPPDLELYPNAAFTRNCGCLYDVVPSRFVDPKSLSMEIEFFYVKPVGQRISLDEYMLKFGRHKYVSELPILIPLCPTCVKSEVIAYDPAEKWKVDGHVHFEGDYQPALSREIPSEYWPEIVFKNDVYLSKFYKLLCRKKSGKCAHCKRLLFEVAQCNCENETLPYVPDECDLLTDCDMDWRDLNNVSPLPSFMVTDKGYCNTYDDIDDCELQYLLTLNDHCADDCASDDERDFLKYNGYH